MPCQEVLAGQKGWRRGAAPLDGGGLPGYGVFETADGRYLAVAALEAQFFQNLCRVLGLEELSGKFAALGKEADQVREKLAAAFRSRTQKEWLEAFSKVEACLEPVWEGDEVLRDPQLGARGMFPHLDFKGASVQLMDTPLRLEGGHAPLVPAPRLGQHTRQALLSAGFSEKEIEELLRSGQAEQAAGD
jgi:alpha-methylacyl-CoA racemase